MPTKLIKRLINQLIVEIGDIGTIQIQGSIKEKYRYKLNIGSPYFTEDCNLYCQQEFYLDWSKEDIFNGPGVEFY